MSTKKETTSNQVTDQNSLFNQSQSEFGASSTSNNYNKAMDYDPQALAAYRTMLPLLLAGWQNDTQLDPRQSKTYNLGLQGALRAVQQMGQQGVKTFNSNLRAGGFGGGNLPAFQQAVLARMGRANSAQRANAWLQNFTQYDANRRNTQQLMAGWNPLLLGERGGQTATSSYMSGSNATGQSQSHGTSQGKQTETTSGLGTWLPQVISGGLGLASAFLGPAAGMGAKSGGGGGGSTPFFSAGNFGSTASPIANTAGPYFQPPQTFTPWYQR